jgi:DNA-binding protein HU-beta
MAGLAEVIKTAGVKEGDAKRLIAAIKRAAAIENVTIRGFGTFKTTIRSARKGRNPQTGAEIQIAAKTVLTFKASK